jgi:hypothetical protein
VQVRRCASILGIFAVGMMPAREAQACSHRCFTPWPMLVAPASGATNVPLNAIVHVHLEGGTGEPERWIALETAVGQPVEVTLELPPWSNAHDTPVRIIPTALLQPRTTYRVRKTLLLLPDGTDIVGTFTTGDLVDATPPWGVDASAVTIQLGPEERCDLIGHDPPQCCSSAGIDAPYRRIALALPDLTSEPVIYTLREGDRIVASDIVGDAFGLESATGALAMDSCTPTRYPWEVPTADRHVLTVTPRDVAGHEGPATEFVVESPGCGCHVRRGSARHGPLLLLLPLLAVRRRRMTCATVSGSF